MKTALYLRVSTDTQNHDSQLHELRRYCEQRSWNNIVEFVEVASGSRSDRSGLERMMRAVRGGKISRVVVYKLDRLGRSLPHLALILHELTQRDVAFVATSQGIDTSDDNPAGRLQLGVLMAVAEFEREIIRERVKAGLATARARGRRLGRPIKVDSEAVRTLKAEGLGVRAIARRLRLSPSTVSSAVRG